MADQTIPGLKRQTPINGPYGNLCIARAKYIVDAAQNDVVVLLRLPRGAAIVDSILTTTALGASVVGALGIRAVNAGAKGAAACLNTGADLSAAAITRRAVPATLIDSALTLDDDDYDVILTLTGANPASGTFELSVIYEYVGTK